MHGALARLIAFYLPQFHPIPENDEWWGRGFTEWTNTAKAKPMFRGHYQPHVPADLGFYDLRLPESRQAQAALARAYGIEAFCYYHYWFAGRRMLERPFTEVLASGQPDFPFCLCWANHTWSGIWAGAPGRVLVEQTYPGEADHRRHFETLLPAFRDPRYVRVIDKPMFIIYRPADVPNCAQAMGFWRDLATEAGLPGLHLVGSNVVVGTNIDASPPSAFGLDAWTTALMPPTRTWVSRRTPVKWLKWRYKEWVKKPTVYNYSEILLDLLGPALPGMNYPCLIPNWDNTPRSGQNGLVFHGATPEHFRRQAREALNRIQGRSPEESFVFIKSWNEWAEGNHLEPDLRFGTQFLDVLRDVFQSNAEPASGGDGRPSGRPRSRQGQTPV
jgi:lipopolysaccharide biosynthesis protein